MLDYGAKPTRSQFESLVIEDWVELVELLCSTGVSSDWFERVTDDITINARWARLLCNNNVSPSLWKNINGREWRIATPTDRSAFLRVLIEHGRPIDAETSEHLLEQDLIELWHQKSRDWGGSLHRIQAYEQWRDETQQKIHEMNILARDCTNIVMMYS